MQRWRHDGRTTLAMLALAGCAQMTSSTMGTPVTGAMFQDEVVGHVLSFRVAGGRLAEAQFQPDGTAVYSGDFIDRVGRWRPWPNGYCAYYPSLGAGPALTPPFSGPVETDGYRCYDVRATDGYWVVFQPDGTYVGTLVPIR